MEVVLFKDQLWKQKKLLILIISIFVFVLGLIYWFSVDFEEQSIKEQNIQIAMPGKEVDKRNLWMTKVEAEAKLRDKKIDIIEKIIENGRGNSNQEDIQHLKMEISQLKRQLIKHEEKKSLPQDLDSEKIEKEEEKKISSLNSRIIVKHDINLTQKKSNTLNVDQFIPAGSFAKSLLLSSLDANCGSNSVSDPKPLTMRILDNAILPNNYKSKVKQCFVIASGYGDLSSERVYMRLEKMSCINKSGSITETDVAGYVVGEDGKVGIRGRVVDKSGAMVASAAMSGFLSGMSQFMQNSVANKTLLGAAANLNGTSSVNLENFKSAGAEGAKTALDRLSEYWIKRADQLQPVIQIDSGRKVNVVFTSGFLFGDKNTKQKLRSKAVKVSPGISNNSTFENKYDEGDL